MRCRIQTYQFIEDAWADGVEDWCRAASALVLASGEAWLLTANAGQAAWIKARLLRAGVALVGVRFPDAASLRRLLCARFGVAPPAFGSDALDFLLRLRARKSAAAGDAEADAIARGPGAWRAALQDLDAAGWLGAAPTPGNSALLPADAFPPPLREWLPAMRESGAWWPAIDRELRQRAEAAGAAAADPNLKPLSTLALGWDAGCWAKRDLLLAALLAAAPVSAQAFFPAPRGIGRGEALAQGWIDAIASGLGPATEVRACGASGFVPPFGPLVERLESVEFSPAESDAATDAQPEMLVGLDWSDQLAVSQEWVARWLAETRNDPAARLAVLFPGRGSGSVEFVRALGRAGIAAEDNLGERAEPPLPVQIARALLDYQLDETGVEPLLTLVGLLNDCPGCWIRDPHDFGLPLEPVALRRALADAFVELQHRNARLLAGDRGVARSSSLADPLGRLVAFLERWPEALSWASARARWEETLAAFKLSAAELAPLWSELESLLPADEIVPARAFFDYLRTVISSASSLPRPATERRAFARVFVTTLTGAVGQTWQGALFMDSNEGTWPHPRDENPCLDDRRRAALNARRETDDPNLGHLLTGADRARIEAANFLEVLENCTGPVAFASIRRAPDDVTRDAHPNEWSLRCWVEAASAAERRADRWLERWRRTAVRVHSRPPSLAKREANHLRSVFERRRDPAVPFDEYLFDFTKLAAEEAGKLPLESEDRDGSRRLAWTARQLEAAWHRPASFALETLFEVQSWRDGFGDLARAESAAVGRLTHRWVQRALGGGAEPRPLSADLLATALDAGLRTARLEDEAALLRSLHGSVASRHDAPLRTPEVPPWWRGVFAKTTWAARQCLETLARRVADDPLSAAWFCAYRPFAATVSTSAGPLQLRARPDLLLLDRPEIAGAACRVVDLKTGSAAAAVATTPAHLAGGRGLGQAAELAVVLAGGADPSATCAAVLGPEAVCWEAFTASDLDTPEAREALSALAQLQNGLRFGQRVSSVNAARSPNGGAETLPLACTPLDPAVLAAKAEL